jgi:hypothetical protein
LISGEAAGQADGLDMLTGRPALDFGAAADRVAAAGLFDMVLRHGRPVLAHRSTLRTRQVPNRQFGH